MFNIKRKQPNSDIPQVRRSVVPAVSSDSRGVTGADQTQVAASVKPRATEPAESAVVINKGPDSPQPTQTEVAQHANQETSISFGGIQFAVREISTEDELMQIVFHKVINAEVKINMHMYSRIAVARLSEAGRECALFVDRSKSSPDEVQEVVALLANRNFTVVRGHFAQSTQILSLAQGHLNGEHLKNARDIARDPAKNALFQTFTEIVGWAYDNKADDIDWALDINASMSQICFKIGGRYVRPPQYVINSETMSHLLGIAWQRSGGGASAQFDIRVEQQAQITLDLPRVEKRRPVGARVRLRWSGMAIDRGTVVTMRLQRLGSSSIVTSLADAGYLDTHMNIFNRVIKSEGGMVCFSGVVGSGKSTSLARLLGMLPDYLKIQSIEDPVELEIPRAYQKTVARDLLQTGPDQAFLSAARAIYRSALDVLYLGEVRDTETGGIARQVVESGHTVYTTTHARSALGIFERFSSPQIGIPRDVLGAPDIVKLFVYQALLPVNCPHCKLSPSEYAAQHGLTGHSLEAHHRYWDRVERLYMVGREQYRVHNVSGCPHCRKEGLPELNGLAGRTVVCEMVEPDDEMLSLVVQEGGALRMRQHWSSLSNGMYDSDDLTGKTSMECAIYKATQGQIDPHLIEERFSSFETIESKRRTPIAMASDARMARVA